MMGGILAYLPGHVPANRQRLIDVGLGSLLDPSLDTIFSEVAAGPDGERGHLVTFCGAIPDAPRSYDAELQEWMAAPPDGDLPKGRYWIGYVKNAKPTAGDLQRKDVIDGEPVVLADNGVWIVPCCEFAPKRLTRDRETGEEIRVVKTEYKTWVDWTNALYSLFVSDGFSAILEKDRVVHIPNGLGYAALCLAQNYRVNMDVIDLLGLIGEYEAFEVARVATGLSIVERVLMQKKSTDR